MKRRPILLALAITTVGLTVIACNQAAPAPAPTTAAAAPTAATAPTKAPEATRAPAAAPAPTQAPAPAKTVAFPEKGKSITLIVPFAAGGSTDIGARLLAPVMEKGLGVPVQVVNKAGGSTQVALSELVTSKPDGYTISFMSVSTSLITYLDPQRKATYGRKDFQEVATYTSEPNAFFVLAENPLKSAKDMIDAAKAKPGQIVMGSPSLMGSSHLPTLVLEKMAGVKFKWVHFDGGGPLLTAFLGGHVEIASAATAQFTPHIKQGKVRVFGLMDSQHSKFFPEVKTLEEEGYKIYAPSTYGIVAPAGTPREIVSILSAAIKKGTEDQEVQNKLAEFGLATRYMDPAQFGTFWTEAEGVTKEALQIAQEK